jgi:hypothetical protein
MRNTTTLAAMRFLSMKGKTLRRDFANGKGNGTLKVNDCARRVKHRQKKQRVNHFAFIHIQSA